MACFVKQDVGKFATLLLPERFGIEIAIRVSDRIGRRTEVELPDAERGHQSSYAGRFGAPDILKAVQHQQRAFIPPEVSQRPCDPPLFDQERAVPREACLQHGTGFKRADVEEVRDEDSSFAPGDELLRGFCAADECQAAG